jgi:hypothetical protein
MAYKMTKFHNNLTLVTATAIGLNPELHAETEKSDF